MKVLFVSAYGKWGRPASYIQSQSQSLRKKGIDVTDFYFKYRGMKGYAKSYFELLSFLRKSPAFDIVHAHFSYTALFVYLCFPKGKFVISFMGDDLYGVIDENSKQTTEGKFFISLAKFLQKKADRIIVKSRRMAEWILPAYKEITTVVPNGVDFEKFPLIEQREAKRSLGLDENKKYILFLGSPNEKRKNYALLQQAYELMKTSDTELINPYPVAGELIYKYLNAADVLVLLSNLEGSPNVIKEALVCNCPIVSSDVGDVDERIEGIDGCVLTGFEPAEIAQKIRQVLDFNSRTKGREKSGYLTTDNIATRISDVYNLALGIKPTAPVTKSKSSLTQV